MTPRKAPPGCLPSSCDHQSPPLPRRLPSSLLRSNFPYVSSSQLGQGQFVPVLAEQRALASPAVRTHSVEAALERNSAVGRTGRRILLRTLSHFLNKRKDKLLTLFLPKFYIQQVLHIIGNVPQVEALQFADENVIRGENGAHHLWRS